MASEEGLRPEEGAFDLVLVPRALFESMHAWEETVLRLLLYLIYQRQMFPEYTAGLSVDDLARGVGVGHRRVERNLPRLIEEGWAAEIEPGRYLLAVPATFSDATPDGGTAGGADAPPL